MRKKSPIHPVEIRTLGLGINLEGLIFLFRAGFREMACYEKGQHMIWVFRKDRNGPYRKVIKHRDGTVKEIKDFGRRGDFSKKNHAFSVLKWVKLISFLPGHLQLGSGLNVSLIRAILEEGFTRFSYLTDPSPVWFLERGRQFGVLRMVARSHHLEYFDDRAGFKTAIGSSLHKKIRWQPIASLAVM